MHNNIYIELDRTFTQVTSTEDSDAPDIDFGIGTSHKTIRWTELLSLHRVTILAEAGSGKTEEIRQTSKKLRLDGKKAFFLRLENIAISFESAFEEGTLLEFNNWLESDLDGWLFLDSIDEARLKSARDFEIAISILAKKLDTAFQRTHIILTSRVNAWRFRTDMEMCSGKLPFASPNENNQLINANFQVYALQNLKPKQVEYFIKERHVTDHSLLISSIERLDAWSHTTLPQDLEELIEYWEQNKKVGSRLELIKHSIASRLRERDQGRAEIELLSETKAYEGARLLAVACTLMNNMQIVIPDGKNNSSGVITKDILPSWNDKELSILLGRPIFDLGSYGTVRFHHRSVREYLAADWLISLLLSNDGRKFVNTLFFRKQYKQKVIIPRLKPLLSWVVIFDEVIRKRARAIEPELIFEAGDPQELPLIVREDVLEQVCRKIASGTNDQSVTSFNSVRKFSSKEISSKILALIEKFKNEYRVESFLMQLVWVGGIDHALVHANRIAFNPQANLYSRIYAIRAIKELEETKGYENFLTAFRDEFSTADRDLIAEVVELLPPTNFTLEWVCDLIQVTEGLPAHQWDQLQGAICDYAERLSYEQLTQLISKIHLQIQQPPYIEIKLCEVSVKFSWLLECGALAILSLLRMKRDQPLHEDCVKLLARIPIFTQYRLLNAKEFLDLAPSLIQEDSALNLRVFWESVALTRTFVDSVTGYWQTFPHNGYWRFDVAHFEQALIEIDIRPEHDDKLVALSLAFHLYVQSGKNKALKSRLKEGVKSSAELTNALDGMLRPPPMSAEQRAHRNLQRKWARQDAARSLSTKRLSEKNNKWLIENHHLLNDPDRPKQGEVTNAQRFLLDKMSSKANANSIFSVKNWKDLIPEYGTEVATSFRSALVSYWRDYSPALRSEGAAANSTPWPVIMGLAGLAIEAHEDEMWLTKLSKHEAAIACRYATYELNGFPAWFSQLTTRFPVATGEVLLTEVQWELENSHESPDSLYIINKLAWAGQWLWPDVAKTLFAFIKNHSVSQNRLRDLMQIVQRSEAISDVDLSELAEKQCKSSAEPETVAGWYSTWVGVNPDKAIKSLSNKLSSLNGADEQRQFAMIFITSLLGYGRSVFPSRSNFKNPKYLKELYLLMHKFMPVSKDIDRLGGGVFSPDLRDDAQHARDGLFSIIKEIPGKESFKALTELSKKYPVKSSRSWMRNHAIQRAEMDADLQPIKIGDVKDILKKFHSGDKTMKINNNLHFSVAILCGLICLIGPVILSIYFPAPTSAQWAIWRTMQVFSALGLGVLGIGSLTVNGEQLGLKYQATGTIALLLILYFFTPSVPRDVGELSKAPSESIEHK